MTQTQQQPDSDKAELNDLALSVSEYMRAAFGGLVIETDEPEDALASLYRLCDRENWHLASWNLSGGLAGSGEHAGDPVAALSALDEADGQTPLLLVVRGFPRFLGSAEIISQLERRLHEGKTQRTTLVLLVPCGGVELPPELRPLLVTLQHDRPDADELADIVRGVATEDDERPEDLTSILNAAVGMTRHEAESACALSLVRYNRLLPAPLWEMKTAAVRASGLMSLSMPGDGFGSLRGLGALKDFCFKSLTSSAADTPWGRTRPDYGRPEVRSYIFDNAKMWVEEYGVDGLRLDMTLYMRHVDGSDDPGRSLPDGWSLTQQINDYCSSREFPVLTVAEDLRKDASLTRPTGDGGAGFRSQWDAAFVHPVRAMLQSPADSDRSPATLREVLQATYDEDPFNRVLYTESHDETSNGKTRLPAEIAPDDPTGEYAIRKSAMGASLMMFCPGIPMLFQGQETLATHWFDDQKPLDWGRVDEYVSLLKLYQDIIALRTNQRGSTSGLTGRNMSILHEDDERKLLAWHRWLDGGSGDDVVIVANLSSTPCEEITIRFPAAGDWTVVFNGDAEVYGHEFGGHTVHDVSISDDNGHHHGVVSAGAYSCVAFARR